MTRSQSSTVKGKSAQARHKAQAKSAQAQAKSAQMRQQAQTRSSAMKQQAQARSAKMRREAQARSAQMREQAARSGPARQARRAATRVAPIAVGVGLSTRKGVRRLRLWAAPQLEQAAHTLEDRVAPRIAEGMIATARQIQPPSRRPRIRWAAFAAGGAAIAAGGAATAYLLSRRSSQPSEGAPPPEPVTGPAAAQEPQTGEPVSRS